MDNRPMIALIVILLLLPGALAMPRVPSEFRGWVIADDRYAKDGTVITVVDSSGTVCGTSLVVDGYYGPLSCQGDDLATPKDEGAELNEPLTFLVNGQALGTKSAVRWQPGQVKEVNLVRGDIAKAELFLLTNSSKPDTAMMIILSLVVIGSFWVITISAMFLAKLIAKTKKKVRWQQVE